MIPKSLNYGNIFIDWLLQAGGTMRETMSPLKLFVKAKKHINAGFCDIARYVTDGQEFLKALNNDLGIVNADDKALVGSFIEKVRGIRDVLARDHMKCVFFGRYVPCVTELTSRALHIPM